MTPLNDTVLKAVLRKLRTAQAEIVDGAVPGLVVQVGRVPAATWSLVFRVRGEGGVPRRGFEKKGRRDCLSLGTYPAMSLEAARARANEFLARANAGESPVIAVERAAAASLRRGNHWHSSSRPSFGSSAAQVGCSRGTRYSMRSSPAGDHN